MKRLLLLLLLGACAAPDVHRLMWSKDPKDRELAAKLLDNTLRGNDAEECIDMLLSEDIKVREEAASKIRDRGVEDAYKKATWAVLIDLIHNKDEAQFVAMQAVARMQFRPKKSARHLLRAVEEEEITGINLIAVPGLVASFGGDSVPPMLRFLKKRMSFELAEIILRAFALVGKDADQEDAMSYLQGIALSSEVPYKFRVLATRAVGQVNARKGAKVLVFMLKKGDPHLRYHAALGLGNYEPTKELEYLDEVADALDHAMKDEDEHVSKTAKESLIRLRIRMEHLVYELRRKN